MTSQWLLMLILGAQHWPHDAWYDQNENNSRRRNARSGQFADHWSTSSGHAYWTNFYAKHAKRAHSRRAGKLSYFDYFLNWKSIQAKEDPPLPEFYHCQKCEFKARSQDREIFQKHIKKHFDSKVDGFQCTECGNCFCSLSALEKHLYMTHKVIFAFMT